MALALVTYTTGKTPTTLLPTIERMLYGNQRTQLNRLNGTATTGASAMTMGFDLDGVRAGAYLEVDSEVVFVWSTSGQVATVQRAMLGTAAAQHTDLSIVRVEPRFFMQDMLDQINTEIRSWPTNVYRRYSGSLAVASSVNAIDVDGLSGIEGVNLLRVQASPSTDQLEKWLRVEGARLERRQASTDFASTYALHIPSDFGQARTLQVLASAPFSAVSLAVGSDFGTVGITADMVDIIPWGVVGRMLSTRDVARTDANAQGRSRPAEEVRPGDAVQVGRAMLAIRDDMLKEAANRLVAQDGMGWS